jgi:hypothetical protein
MKKALMEENLAAAFASYPRQTTNDPPSDAQRRADTERLDREKRERIGRQLDSMAGVLKPISYNG